MIHTPKARRNRLDFNAPAEIAIYNAMLEVEKLSADIRLTKVSVLLGEAKEILSDYIDSKVIQKIHEKPKKS